MDEPPVEPLLRKVDAVTIRVPDLDAGFARLPRAAFSTGTDDTDADGAVQGVSPP